MRRFLLPPGPKPPAQVASVCNASSSRPVALMHSTVCDRINRAAALDSTLFDIGRIEMLLGPQGTLFGRSSAGGLVNITTNKPTKELRVSPPITGLREVGTSAAMFVQIRVGSSPG
jgi:outer membrane receptor for monomeric catechols